MLDCIGPSSGSQVLGREVGKCLVACQDVEIDSLQLIVPGSLESFHVAPRKHLAREKGQMECE